MPNLLICSGFSCTLPSRGVHNLPVFFYCTRFWLGLGVFALFYCLGFGGVSAQVRAQVSVQADSATQGFAAAETSRESQSFFTQAAEPLRDTPPIHHLFGKPALVVLFQPNCGYCKIQMRTLTAFVRDTPKFQVIAVSEYGRRAALTRLLDSQSLDINAYMSSPDLLSFLGNPRGSPQTFLIDKYGRVLVAARGTQSIEHVHNFVRLSGLEAD